MSEQVKQYSSPVTYIGEVGLWRISSNMDS